MRVGNEPCLSAASWEPYAAEKPWALAPGAGWRTVYVQASDALSRTVTVSDTIYVGAAAPSDELSAGQMSAAQDYVTLYHLDGAGWPLVQFSLSWTADDSFATFARLFGLGQRVDDADALGGTAFRMDAGDGMSSGWVWTRPMCRSRCIADGHKTRDGMWGWGAASPPSRFTFQSSGSTHDGRAGNRASSSGPPSSSAQTSGKA